MSERLETWKIEPSESAVRLDVAVASYLEDVSRARVKKWIEDGRVRIDGKIARPSRLCREGESVEVVIPAPVPASPEAEAIPLSILYEDEHLVVVDKPAGMVVHPSPGHRSKTLVNALLAHCHDLSGIGGVERPGIVHRLDSGTTGVLVVAKHDQAHQHLATQFQERRVRKRYLAVVHGTPPEHLVIDRAIGRDRMHRTKISTRTNHPRSATSTVERLERLPHSALVAIQIHTGRTHQIRVHLSEAGYPIAGDQDYGAPRKRASGQDALAFKWMSEFPRPALHAESLTLTHPKTGEEMNWTAPIPSDINDLLEKLRRTKVAGVAGTG